ncbi:MAG: hypothetical protein CME20_09930 [Gemmatimonadetes bacterium]|nr:hypothetical protein [Gemmatimonadota bacterium]
MALLDTNTQVSAIIGDFGSGLDHPECITWGCDGYAYAGGEAGQIYRIDLAARTFEEFANVGGFVGGICQDAQHRLYVCVGDVKRVDPDGTVSTYCDRAGDTPLKVANYPVFDAHGNLYVSDSGGWLENSGWICKIAPGGAAEVWSRDLSEFPNGTAMDAAGEYLYVAMSTDPGIARIEINADGSAGAAEMLVSLPETVPDGLAFDTEGTIYCSCYRPDRIYQYTADGQLDILADDYAGTAIAAPTNIAFCGPELDLFLSANLGRWHISKYELGKIGQPLNYPEVP